MKPARPAFGVVTRDVIRDPSLSGSARLAYAILCTYADQERTCWPSVKTVAVAMGASESTANRSIRELVERGVVEREERKADDGQQSSSITRLTDVGVPVTGDTQVPVTSDTQTRPTTNKTTTPTSSSLITPREAMKIEVESSRTPQPIAPDWQPARSTAQQIKKEFSNVRGREEVDRFIAYNLSKGSKSHNWDALFLVWCSNAQRKHDEQKHEGTDDLGFPMKSRAAWNTHLNGSVTEGDATP